MTSFKIDTSSPVLVTGATGYVAGVLIQQLLQAGVRVHAAVRDPTQTARLAHLTKLAQDSPGSIAFFQGDLLTEGSYTEGMKGCSIVFHTASPFVLNVKDAQKELVDPAVQGTTNVLNTVNQTPSVQRVILTSSCAAIYTDTKDTYGAPGEILTEQVWNRTASLTYQPYSLSKTLAEQAAWVMAGSQNQWTLATINPSMVMGPGTKYSPSAESFAMLQSFGDGRLASGCPNICLGIVDVRDVAQAHIVAAYRPGVQGRHILCGHCTDFWSMAEALRPKFSAYPLPQRKRKCDQCDASG